MMRATFFFVFFIFSQMAAAEEGTPRIQIIPRYGYQNASFAVSTDSTAGYSGSGYGFDGALKFQNKQYGLSLLGGYSTFAMDNAANTAAQKESIEGVIVNIGARFYGSGLFLGIGVLHTSFTDSYVGVTSSTTKYSGLGFRVEAGVDMPIGRIWVFSPKIYYDISNVSPAASSGTSKRFEGFGANVGFGVEF